MEGLDEQLSLAFLDVHEAHRSKRDSTARIKGMNELILALAGLELIVKHPKHVGRDVFEFELSVVGHSLFAIHLFDVFPLEVGTHQPSFLWQKLFGRADDFCHYDGLGVERDDMAIASDINLGRVLGAFDGSTAIDTKEFGVKGSSKNVESMLGNCRSDRKHEGNLALLGRNELRR